MTALKVAESNGHVEIATMIRNRKQKGADRMMKDVLLQTSPEKFKRQQEDSDRAMKELLEEEEKSAAGAASVSQKKSNKSKKKKAGDQGVSASSKAAPWATEAKETGTGAAGVGVEVRSLAELSFGGGGGQRSTAVAAGSGSGEVEDLFKSMDIECTVCMNTPKARHPAH